jgi:ABC-2 type transport system ATP-binding protein
MPETGSPCVRVRDLTKHYGAVEAVRGVTFDVAEGEIFGLLGPNGAGKTSILECLLGLRRPDSGTLEIGGVDAIAHAALAKERVGAQIQLASLQDKLTAREALGFFASFYRDHASVDELIERFELSSKADAPFGSLSGGQRQRLFLALAFVNHPRLVVLDEPTSGLDVLSRTELHRLILGLRSTGRTVLLSTHYMEEAHALCDRVAILSEGRIVAEGSPAGLISRARAKPRLEIRTEKPLAAAVASALPGVAACRIDGNAGWLDTDDVSGTITALTKKLEADANLLLDIQVHRPSLEDVFVELTGRPWTDAEPEGAK